MIFPNWIDWAAFAWFLISWAGYTAYAREKAKHTESLTAVMYHFRESWVRQILTHENRITDIALLGNLVHMNNFFASTTILVLAGALTVLFSADTIVTLLSGHTLIAETTKEQVQFKVTVLILIFVFAFFRFTWSMRQHSFCAVMISAVPPIKKEDMTEDNKKFANYIAKISDRAGNEFNYGLRAYYFALCFLTWFISPYALIPATTTIVWVLYRREFRSTTLKYMKLSRQHFPE